MSSSMSSKWRWRRRYSTWGWRWGRSSTRSRLRLSSNNNLYLPEELLEEILSWLPVKSLFRFRCVQKTWSTLFWNPTLIAKHLLHHQTKTENPSLLVMSSDSIRHGFTLHPYLDDDNAVRILDGSKDLGLVPHRWPIPINLFDCINGIICIGGSMGCNPTFSGGYSVYFPYGIQQSENVRSFFVPDFLSVLFFLHITLQNFLHLVMINILMTTRWLELSLTTRILHLPRIHSSQLFTP